MNISSNEWRGPHDWPTGWYYGKCILCDASYTGPKRSSRCYKCECTRNENPPDYEKIKKSKTQLMMTFEELRKAAEQHGAIVYKII